MKASRCTRDGYDELGLALGFEVMVHVLYDNPMKSLPERTLNHAAQACLTVASSHSRGERPVPRTGVQILQFAHVLEQLLVLTTGFA